MTSISSDLLDSLRGARLTRVLLVYLGGSFAVLEVVDIFTEQFGLPNWVFPGALVLLLVGLPVVVATAVVEGRRRDEDTGRQPTPDTVLSTDAAPEQSTAEAMSGVGDQPIRSLRRWLSWRKAILGLVFAFALWGLVVAGYMAMRHLGIGPVGSLVAAGVLEERDRVILAEFENRTADPVLGQAVTEALRVDLAQSRIVSVVDPAFVNQVLQRMQRGPDAHLDRELAREVAIREGIAAVIAGEVNTAGSGVVLSAELYAAEGGEVLAAFRESARDSTEIIPAIDRLSDHIRARIGESLKSIRANEPLDRVTTGSLAALRKYSQAVEAVEAGEVEKGIALLEEAIHHDTAFAMAYRKLGVAVPGRARQVEVLEKAYEHRDRLTDRERYLTLGTYYSFVTNELDKAVTAYQTLLDAYPNDTWAMNNLGTLYIELGEFERGRELLTRATERDSLDAGPYLNVTQTHVALGDWARAESTLARLRAKAPEHPLVPVFTALLASARGDHAKAAAPLERLLESRGSSASVSLNALSILSELALVQGRLSDAEARIRRLQDAVLRFGVPGQFYVLGALQLAYADVFYRGDTASAVRRVRAALDRMPLDSIAPLDRPYLTLSIYYSAVGWPDSARAIVRQYRDEVDPISIRGAEPDLQVALGAAALAEGQGAEAVEHFRAAYRPNCPICALPLLARAYELTGQRDSAIAVRERYVQTPWLMRIHTDWWALGPVYERLAKMYGSEGNDERARLYYGRLLDLWADADAVLQPRVEAARRALESLSAES